MSKLNYRHPVYKLSARLWREVFKASLRRSYDANTAANDANRAVFEFEDRCVTHESASLGFEDCPLCGGNASFDYSQWDEDAKKKRISVVCSGVTALHFGCGLKLVGKVNETEDELRARWNTTTASRRFSRG